MWCARAGRRLPGTGFSSIEVLVTSALFSLVIAGVYLLYTTMQETLDRGQVKSDLQQNARIGLDRLVRELRMAGYSTGSPVEPVRAAAAGCLAFMHATHQITYDTGDDANDTGVPRRKILRRRQDGGGAQPQAETVAALAFAYYDVDNQALTPGTPGRCPPAGGAALVLAADQLRQVTRVAITLRTTASLGDPHPGESYTLKSHVRLRNR